MKSNKILIKNSRWNEARLLKVVDQRGVYEHVVHHSDLKIENGRFVESFSSEDNVAVVDAKNKWCLPGAIDTQVHLREPGLVHKEDLESGSRSALRGGTTSFFEMPNTKPATDCPEALAEKLQIAQQKSWGDYAFYGGATPTNAEVLKEMEAMKGCCGIKVFMGSSTGDLLVDQIENLKTILSQTSKRVAVHCEDEKRLTERKTIFQKYSNAPVQLHPLWRDEETAYLATQNALRLARQLNRQVHVLHVTTAQEVELLKIYKDVSTFEVLPQHLHFTSPDCYQLAGSLAQMNPPIRSRFHQEALLEAVRKGHVTVMGSDHAPHTWEEKQKQYPQSPSGITGAQYFYRAILSLALNGQFSFQRALELAAFEPARLFGIQSKGHIAEGFDADFVLFDDSAQTDLSEEEGLSRSPNSIWQTCVLEGRIHQIYKQGELVFCEEADIFRKPSHVQALNFLNSISR